MEWNRRLTAWALAGAMLATGTMAVAENDIGPVIDEGDPTVVVATVMTVPATLAELPGLDSRYLMLASAAEPLAASYEPMDLVSITSRRNDNSGQNENGGIYMASSQNMQLVDAALSALKRMFETAEGEGVTLYLRQAYRSYEDEVSHAQRMAQRGETGDVPGQSDWQTGLAVTVVPKALRTKPLDAEKYNATAEAQWISANCARFGFVVRYPDGKSDVTGHGYEPWHLRYVGESAAEYMMQRNMTLEEFRQELDLITGGYEMPEGAPVAVKPAEEKAPAAENVPVAENAEPAQTPAPAAEDEAVAKTVPATPAPVAELPDDMPAVDNRYLMLASAAEPLNGGYAPMGLKNVTSRRNDNSGNNENGGIYMASSASMQLVDTVLDALTAMFKDAEKADITLYLRQAYRSYEDEQARCERMSARGNVEDKPGESDWQTGLAVTVVPKALRTKTLTEENYLKTKEGQWVVENCAAYGFIIRYPQGGEAETGRAYEPWHLRYVGVETAQYMTENTLTLEAFRASLDVLTGGYVMPEGDSEAAAAWAPPATPTPKASPTPVPDMLPGGAKLLDTAEDGDWEFSLFGN